MGNRILIIEDNEDILANIYAYLEPLGYRLDCARNGKSGLQMALAEKFDCILLDILLPGMDGVTLCRTLREDHHCATPIIMLTALNAEDERVRGLDAGADDYLAKPYSLRELEARIRAILRRGKHNSGACIRYADLEINTSTHTATRAGQPLRLSPASFRILTELARHAPAIVRRLDLEELLWGDLAPCASALRTHIHELRAVLDKPYPAPLLHTVPHVGYRLATDDEP